MIDPRTRRRIGYRTLFVALVGLLMFLHLLPLNTLPARFAGPDLILCITLAWVQRRPRDVPPLAIALVFLMADFLLMRPPGLMAALVLVGAEFLRSRHQGGGEMPFLFEWGMTGGVIAAVAVANLAVLSVLAADHAAPGVILVRALMTVLAYPAVVGLLRAGAGLRRRVRDSEDVDGIRV